MKKERENRNRNWRDAIINYPPATLCIAILSICLGVFFIYSQSSNKPIPRTEAVAYSGEFDAYETRKNYCGILFRDGSCYEVYPHTETSAFRKTMESLASGTKLSVLVNPNNGYVAEIKTETEELLNFELSQQEIDAYDNWYIAIGWLACLSGIFLIVYVIASKDYKQKEKFRQAERKERLDKNAGSPVLRYAEAAIKGKTLLEITLKGYEICYRRIRFVNELVINGRVYDEKKGIVEFEHALYAVVNGHSIEAGYDEESFSYIKFDGTVVRRKKRLI